MANRFWQKLRRRDLFVRGGALAAVQALGGRHVEAAPLDLGPDMYRSIGVRPIINARGTFTIITGSETLPEVKRAMDLASRGFVHMDELMDAVGQRLADLSGAQWGIVTGGCSAAMTHCASAAIAGGNPERMQKLPDTTGLKNEIIVPAYSRNVYDHAVRMVGAKLVVVRDPAEAERAFNDRTAMVYILGGPGDDGPLGTRAMARLARPRNVPVAVDAAAEILTLKPNVHLERGATAVAYSGGKCIRAPQAAGLLLGEKKFLQAAWINSAPHHAFGRSLKVGKEEIMGMLAAVELWVKRDHKAEWAVWEGWLNRIAASVTRVEGVRAAIHQPSADLSNRTPELTIEWDAAKIGIAGQELSKYVFDTEPRISLARAGAGFVAVVPYQMMPGDEGVVAERLYTLLAKPPRIEKPALPPAGAPAAVAGEWDVELEFGYLTARHTLALEEDGGKLKGKHHAEFDTGDLNGTVAANTVKFQSSIPTAGTRVGFQFAGKVDAGTMSGTVGLGEYGEAKFRATRRG